MKGYGWEEGEEGGKLGEVLGECVWDSKRKVEKGMKGEWGGWEEKKGMGSGGKEVKVDGMEDSVEEMGKEEGGEGKGLEGL